MSQPSHPNPPVLSAAGSTGLTTTNVTTLVTSDPGDGTLYVIVSTVSTQPTSDQIIAGTDATGAAAFNNNGTPAVGVNALGLSGLTAGTAYFEWFVQQDSYAQLSNIVGGTFSTSAATPPPPAPAPAPASAPSDPLWLPFDPTGVAPSNLRSYEYQTAQSGQKAIVKCNYGPFYEASFSIEWEGLNNFLSAMTPNVDYALAEFDAALTARTGKAVYKAILILNTTLPGTYALTYQAVGGSNNVNVSLVDQQSNTPLTDATAIDFNDIQQQPATYPPKLHLHDLKDLYGTEYVVTFLADLRRMVASKYDKFGGTNANAKDAELFAAVTNFKATTDADNFALSNAIVAHIGNTGYPHSYTKAMIGLGNVSDGGFTAINDVHGNPLPVYASPYTVGQGLANQPAPTVTNHRTLTNNPHGDDAADIGLGYLLNIGMAQTYTLGTFQYAQILNVTNPALYVSAYVAANAVTEAQAAQVTLNLNNPLNTITMSGGLLEQTTDANTAAMESITEATTALADTSTALLGARTQVGDAEDANTRFNLVSGNSPYAAMLQALLAYDYSNVGNGSQTALDGYYPVPNLLDNIYLWLDVGYSKNNYQTDTGGVVRLMGLTDRSPSARLFVSNNLSTAPAYTDSQDIVQGVAGISVGKVAAFSPGQHMDQISGPPVCLNPGMTIISLIRTLGATTPFTLLADTSPVPLALVQAQSAPGVALSLTAGQWTPLISAAGTIDPNTSTIVVASVAEADETTCWYAGCKPLPAGAPRGTNTPPTVWPPTYFQSAPMTRIGNANAQSLDGGELVEQIIFNRQLSFAEVQAVIDYLRLAKSHNLAFVVDTSAMNAF